MDVRIRLTDEQKTCIEAAVSRDGVAKVDHAILCQLAVDLLCDCISGKTRFRSLTELNLEVVQRIYEKMLDGECPSADRLFNGFNLPPGQAAYIARVLVEKAVPTWRLIGLKELRSQVDAQVEAKKGVKADQEKDSSVQFDVTRRAMQELNVISNSLMRLEPNTFVMHESLGGIGEYRRVKMLVVTLRRICKFMKEKGMGNP